MGLPQVGNSNMNESRPPSVPADDTLRTRITQAVLPHVQGPAQYVGRELNSVTKDHAGVRATLCLAFPDTYPLGMSSLGLQVLYALMNARDDVACERAFLPAADMADALRQHAVPLYGLESFTPLAQFDVVGFTLQYEMTYTNVLAMLDLGGIPIHSSDRGPEHPLVIAGGPGAFNPEPMAPFVDLFVVGDGEPSLPALVDRVIAWKSGGVGPREQLLADLSAEFAWAYVPSLYEPRYGPDGAFAGLERRRADVREAIQPCVLADLESVAPPTRPIVPYVQAVHDRMTIEIMRGCPSQCRFCQSTVHKRPVRVRSVDAIVDAVTEIYRHTGYEEVGLLSLSSSDYPDLEGLVRRLSQTLGPLGVRISLPSLRVNDQLRRLPGLLADVGRAGLTIAPEVARDTMRRRLAKRLDNEHLYAAVEQAYRNGWRSVKLYFMIGLPGECPEDLDGIAEVADTCSRLRRKSHKRTGQVHVSVSSFVPKPHTPFQWACMQTESYLHEAQRYLRHKVRERAVRLKFHNHRRSLLEGLLCRGDRRVAQAVELAWQNGALLDGWDEHFKPDVWHQAIGAAGIDPDWYLHRQRPLDEALPWDHITTRRAREAMAKEWTQAQSGG